MCNEKNNYWMDTIVKCLKERFVVSLYTKYNDDGHFTGYIVNSNESEFLLKHISGHGHYDGYMMMKIEDVFRIEYNGDYEKKISILYELKNDKLCGDDELTKMTLCYQDLLEYSKSKGWGVSLEIDGELITGLVEKVEDQNIEILLLDDFGRDNGIALLDVEQVDVFYVNTMQEQDIMSVRGRF